METAEGRAHVNGIDVFYRVQGEGEPLLMIMGLSGNADWWHPSFLNALAERYRVATFDNRGAGRTTQDPGPYSIPMMVEDTAGLMDHLGWSSAHVVGASMGGMIAQELALTRPERVRKLVLMVTNCGGPESIPPKPEVMAALNMPRKGLSDEDIARASLFLLFPPQFMQDNPELMAEMVKVNASNAITPRCFVSQLNAIMAWSDHSRLGNLRHPTLIITGSEDILIPPENSRILADAIPGSRLVVFEGGGHGLFAQFPQQLAEEILSFLA